MWLINSILALIVGCALTGCATGRVAHHILKGDGSYNHVDDGGGDNAIAITVTFDEAVHVSGTPTITLETGAANGTGSYVSGSGGTTLTFTYTVATGHTSTDLEYSGTDALAAAGGAWIRDANSTDANTATLTLPGLAGIALTIGMAVDANVLIFERIKEEIKTEKSNIHAFDIGYKRAQSAVLDANITTLISAVILFFLGSGPVKGFAVTLAIGIITTLFSAYFLARHLTSLYVMRNKDKKIII